MALVIDASIALGWLTEAQATPLSRAALVAVNRESGLVPAHFSVEIARSLRNLQRRDLVTEDFVDSNLAILRSLRLQQDTARALDFIERVVAISRRHGLRVADAAYVELALRVGLPLATQDLALARAAIRTGAALFNP